LWIVPSKRSSPPLARGNCQIKSRLVHFTASRTQSTTVYPDLSAGMAAAVNTLYTASNGSDLADVHSPQGGIRFLSRATDTRYLGKDSRAAAQHIESAARMASAGAVSQMALGVADSASQSMLARLQPPAAGVRGLASGDEAAQTGMWAAPMWQHFSARDLDAGQFKHGYSGNLGGLALGADTSVGGGGRLGLMLHAGGGQAESRGDFRPTENEIRFWGAGLYGSWDFGNFSLALDAGYTNTENELEQKIDAALAMPTLRADVDSDVWEAGVNGAYRIRTSAVDIIPHAGVRGTFARTEDYDVKSGSDTVMHSKPSSRQILTLPVGVRAERKVQTSNGWNVRASVDVTAVPALGDVKSDDRVILTGLPGSYAMETEIMDKFSVRGGVGLEISKDNMSLDLGYTVRASRHSHSHGVFAMLRYEF